MSLLTPNDRFKRRKKDLSLVLDPMRHMRPFTNPSKTPPENATNLASPQISLLSQSYPEAVLGEIPTW